MGAAKAGKFVLQAVRQISKVYITAYLAARMVRKADKEWADVSKEGNVKVFNAENIDLSYFQPLEVVYPPKALHTQAIQVTTANIGALSLELEVELFYDKDMPCIRVLLERRNDEGETCSRGMVFRIGDWIVSLWGEIHKFQNDMFTGTFHFMEEQPGSHSAVPANTYRSMSGLVEEPGGTQIIPRVEQPDFPGMG